MVEPNKAEWEKISAEIASGLLGEKAYSMAIGCVWPKVLIERKAKKEFGWKYKWLFWNKRKYWTSALMLLNEEDNAKH